MWKFLFKTLTLAAAVVIVVTMVQAALILQFSSERSDGKADAAIVLGAAAWGNKPSPVYRERINEAIRLYKLGKVNFLIFTGGTRESGFPTEAEVGKIFAMQHGVAEKAIILETESRTTQQNLENSQKLMDRSGIHSALLVSDPLHMYRVMQIAKRLGLNSQPAPTETSRYETWSTRTRFLLRETWLCLEYSLLGTLLPTESS